MGFILSSNSIICYLKERKKAQMNERTIKITTKKKAKQMLTSSQYFFLSFFLTYFFSKVKKKKRKVHTIRSGKASVMTIPQCKDEKEIRETPGGSKKFAILNKPGVVIHFCNPGCAGVKRIVVLGWPRQTNETLSEK
jgi:hypothetical protein